MNSYFLLIAIIFTIVLLTVIAIYFFRPKQIQSTESIYTKALNAIIQSDTKVALKHLRDVVKQDTNHIDAYLQIGNILREEGNIEGAIKIHRSLTMRPNLSKDIVRQIHKSLALDYYKSGNLNRAKEEAEIVLKSHKKNLWANEFLLEIYETQSEWKEAAQFSKSVQRIKASKDPDRLSRFLVLQSMDKQKNDQSDEAISLLKRAIKTSPEFGLPYLKLGDIYASNNQFSQAIKNWEKFIDLNPNNGEKVLSKIESAYFDLGQFDEVEKFYNRIIDKNPSNLVALVNLANVLQQKGEFNESMNLIDEALINNENSIFIHLMKLKLSLKESENHHLSNSIDKIFDLLQDDRN